MKQILNKIRKKVHFSNIVDNIKYLLTNNLYDREYRIKDETIEDCVLFFDDEKESIKILPIVDYDNSLITLRDYPKTFIRYGDGEVEIIRGYDCGFQKYNPELARRLREILESEDDSFYLGINRSYFQSPTVFSEHNRRFYRLHGTALRRFFVSTCSKRRNVFLDASCFGAYFRFDDSFDYDAHYKLIEDLFANKKIAIVCGKGIISNLEYDVFYKAIDKIVIEAPIKDAYDAYDSIFSEVLQKIDKSYLVCIILGMTAKVLAYDLHKLGYMAWDVGHLAKDYNAYKSNIPKTQKNKESFWKPD